MHSDSLSPRVNLEQSRKQAKDLLKAFKAGDPQVLDRIRWNHPRFRGLTDDHIRKGPFVLADAQLVIARLHYFENWSGLLRHIETIARQDPRVSRFEDAADAIISGDVAKLEILLRAHPDLVTQRSTRAHGAPLLHYVAANGVEDYRQLSPANAVDVARVLLNAGAEVDATSHAYGGGSTALGLVATSTPPRRAGVQLTLIDLLLQRGAALDGVRPGTSYVRDALANGCQEAARALADRGAGLDIVAAAGVGRVDLVRKLADVANARELEEALVTAAGTAGAYDVVEYLLHLGVDVAAGTGWTALHAATGGADLRIIDLLISRGAPLEKRNMYGGSALGQAIWFASHRDPADIGDYVRVIDMLIAAGARTDAYPQMMEQIEDARRRATSG
ncbi:MAG TPA: ankyrin repeat domain-containing protein [Longimicrobiales bacterium]|nr:ankyrin repeat domain-containing protein [Longimicrobiales bacterium]